MSLLKVFLTDTFLTSPPSACASDYCTHATPNLPERDQFQEVVEGRINDQLKYMAGYMIAPLTMLFKR